MTVHTNQRPEPSGYQPITNQTDDEKTGVRAYYRAASEDFLLEDDSRILGLLAAQHDHALEGPQRWAWIEQIKILRVALAGRSGQLFLEFYIPRMGKRADALFVTNNVVFVIEFKVGSKDHASSAIEQVQDYALDLKNFHEGSHSIALVPILVSTEATAQGLPALTFAQDLVSNPIAINATELGPTIDAVVASQSFPQLDIRDWMAKGYKPTPTIIEAAETLYRTHSVADISRSDAGARNLQETTSSVFAVIDESRRSGRKAICFVTGVPGSGKTLAGLNIATRRSKEHQDEHAVFLSGNGPLVDVLREALARDKSRREAISKANAQRQARSFIQNVHHFRDEYVGSNHAPHEKVVVFDEAQRAWTRQQASAFMQRKRGHRDFDMSEPEFLVSVMDRHGDWCAIVCLIGGGQEINTGEAGIAEWILALESRFSHWSVYVSPRISHADYAGGLPIDQFLASPRVKSNDHLHLAVSMRSFRAEALSDFIGHVVDNEPWEARATYAQIAKSYPIYLTRDLKSTKEWLRQKARGTERFGLVASSGAHRLRPLGIHMKSQIEPSTWFLNDAKDVRSSYYLEDVASEFDVQGLELDWVGVCWDCDFYHDGHKWATRAFRGSTWQEVRKAEDRLYLKNAYRVILTRARQGMVIFVPEGDAEDWTRPPGLYDSTYSFLIDCGIADMKDI